MEQIEIDKIFKPSKKMLITSLVLILIAIALVIIPTYIESANKPEAKSLHDLIYNYQDNEGEYAKIDLAFEPYGFAIEDERLQYYFAMDKDGYMYIVRLTDETYNELVKLQEEKQDEFSYELKGYIYTMPEELKEIAIESYNEISEEKILTEENLEEYVGSVYLDETITPGMEYTTVMFVIAGIISFIAIIIFIMFVIYMIRIRKTDKEKIELAKEELGKTTSKAYTKQNIYLTDKYIISNYNGLYILEYEEILWIYTLINYYRGIATGKTLIVATDNKKKISLGHTSNANDQTLEEIITKINEKNPDIKLGYTDENRKYFKDLKKEKSEL